MTDVDLFRRLEVKRTDPAPHSLRIIFMGVATVLLDDGETAIMTDGFFSRPGRAELLFTRIGADHTRISSALARAGVHRLAAVLTAHSHHDHVLDAPEVARRTGALLIGSQSTAVIARAAGIDEAGIRVIKGGETFSFGRFKTTIVKSPHSRGGFFMGDITSPFRTPARVWQYREGGNYSFLVEHEQRRILIHASANFEPGVFTGMHADVVFLGIGRLGREGEEFTKQYWHEVVRATGAKAVVPIHWDDFTKSLDEPLQPMSGLLDDVGTALRRILHLAEESGVAVRVLPAFSTVDIDTLRQPAAVERAGN